MVVLGVHFSRGVASLNPGLMSVTPAGVVKDRIHSTFRTPRSTLRTSPFSPFDIQHSEFNLRYSVIPFECPGASLRIFLMIEYAN